MNWRMVISVMSLVMMLSSCFKEDEKVMLPPPGDNKTAVIGLENDYRYQVYFNLTDNEIVSQNIKTEWDLGFECTEEGWHIILNSSLFMLAANTNQSEFISFSDTTGLIWKFDKSDGDLDSTAIGSWVINNKETENDYTNHVYFINRGYDIEGRERGIVQVKFREVSSGDYSFTFLKSGGSDTVGVTIKKDPEINFISFSFDEGGSELTIEPPKDSWDLLFSQYTTLLYTDIGDPYPYLVTGVLLNPLSNTAARDTTNAFNSITLSSVSEYEFSANKDIIGYDWKDVTGDVTSGNVVYAIVPDLSFVINDKEGLYYKLRFINFYSNTGEKGFPTFEYQRL